MSQQDTLVKQNSAATGVFLEGTLEEQRTALLNDLGNIPEVTADFMLDHIVQNIDINVDHTMRKLKGNEVLLGGAGWKEFVGALPKKSSDTEQKVFFSKMGTIYKGIIDSTVFDDGSPRTPTMALGASPDIVRVFETNVRSHPDGCGQLGSNNSFHNAAILLRRKATITGSILHM